MISNSLTVDLIGWLGTLLVVASITQARAVRLHVMNLLASLILTFYNMLINAIPGIGLNIGLMLVNTWRLWVLLKPVKVLSGGTNNEKA
jgi:hypothetical protein